MSGFIIGNRYFDFYELKNEDAQSEIKYARTYSKPIYCACSFFKKRELVSASRSNLFYLKSFPSDGINHDENCKFYHSSIGGNKSLGAFKEDLESGVIDVKLDVLFNQKIDKKNNTISNDTIINKYAKSMTRNSTTLLGLLRKVWYESSLYIYRPNKNYNDIFSKVLFRNFMNVTSSKKSGKDFIYLLNPEWKSSINSIIKKISVSYPIIVGVFDGFVINNEEQKYYIKLKGYLGRIKIEYSDYQDYQKFCNNKSAWQQNYDDCMDIVICQCQIGEIRNKNIRYLQLKEGTKIQSMMVNDKYIPFDSSYEREMTKYLIDNNRAFRKPMYIDQNHNMMPDFILNDMDEDVCIEVWGMDSNKAYKKRKMEKIKLYNDAKIKLIEWNRLESKIPNLPKKLS